GHRFAVARAGAGAVLVAAEAGARLGAIAAAGVECDAGRDGLLRGALLRVGTADLRLRRRLAAGVFGLASRRLSANHGGDQSCNNDFELKLRLHRRLSPHSIFSPTHQPNSMNGAATRVKQSLLYSL